LRGGVGLDVTFDLDFAPGDGGIQAREMLPGFTDQPAHH